MSRWSPLSCLPPAPLTPSGLIALDASDGEVELLSRSRVELRSAQDGGLTRVFGPDGKVGPPPRGIPWVDRDEDLDLTLTTHRAVVSSSSGKGPGINARMIHLGAVADASPSGGGMFASYKVRLQTLAYGELVLVFRGSKSSSSSAKKDRDEALSSLERALGRRQWEESARLAAKKAESSVVKLAGRKVGVDAVMTRTKLKHKEAARLADETFEGGGDVEGLMREAGELVSIIRKYTATLERQKNAEDERGFGGGSSGGAGDYDSEEAAQLASMLDSMGMVSGLGKGQHSDKDAYRETLARQLCDFLRHGDRLKRAGGMITLTDAYCLFNRARGTNMVSPDDLLAAVDLMKGLKLGMSKREFPSGVVVVQDDGFDDKAVAEKLRKLCRERGNAGLTALDASRAMRIPALLAEEQLLSTEARGGLCRDVTLEGTRFFENRFMTGEFDGWLTQAGRSSGLKT